MFILYLLQFLKSRVYPGFAAQNPGSEPAKNRRVTRVVGLPGTRVRSPMRAVARLLLSAHPASPCLI